ncbi:conserved hypothetical protein, secreted, partial [methanotrophic bacterial endosymbiont of Bathymodiolus sp.]
MSKTLQSALALSTLALLAGCLGGNDSSILAGGDGPTVTNPNEETPVELEPGDGIRVLSNRADLISDGNALVEITAEDLANLQNVKVMLGSVDVSDQFALRENGRYMGRIQGLALGENRIMAVLKNTGRIVTTITNHPNGGPVFSGPQVQPWTCTNEGAMDAQCNQPAVFSFSYLPAN